MERCPVCHRDDYLVEVPNSPTGEIWCGNPVHGDNPPAWVPAEETDPSIWD